MYLLCPAHNISITIKTVQRISRQLKFFHLTVVLNGLYIVHSPFRCQDFNLSTLFSHCPAEIMAYSFILLSLYIIASLGLDVTQSTLSQAFNDSLPSSRILSGLHEIFMHVVQIFEIIQNESMT
jgi:hypothetical protein